MYAGIFLPLLLFFFLIKSTYESMFYENMSTWTHDDFKKNIDMYLHAWCHQNAWTCLTFQYFTLNIYLCVTVWFSP